MSTTLHNAATEPQDGIALVLTGKGMVRVVVTITTADDDPRVVLVPQTSLAVSGPYQNLNGAANITASGSYRFNVGGSAEFLLPLTTCLRSSVTVVAEEYTDPSAFADYSEITDRQDDQTALLASIDATVAAPPVPAGAATEAKQDTGNASLASIAAEDFATQATLVALNAKVTAVDTGHVTVDAAPGLTDAQLRATPVPVSGPLTDAQLRASAVPVSGSFAAGAGTTPTYTFQTGFNAPAANKIMFDVFNAAGSGKVIRVIAIALQKNMAAITGVATQFNFDTTTAVGTGGTVLTIRACDSANPAVPAQITARHAPTGGATLGFTRISRFYHSEETNVAAQVQEAFPFWPAAVMGAGNWQECVVREGAGVRLQCITSTTVGAWNVFVMFTLE